MLILNEQKYAQEIYDGKNNDIKSIISRIRYITRHLLHTEQKSDADNYTESVQWLKQHHDNFNESCYSNLISDAIKKAYKYPFYRIDHIAITQSELDTIASLDDPRAEKVLFVLLCMAKQQSVANGFTNGLVKYSLADLCKMARISVPADEREYILYNIIQKKHLDYPKKNNSQCLIVNFIDNESDAVLMLDEVCCTELAYEYLKWKNDNQGYDRCEFCGKVIKQYKSHPRRFCKECESVVGEVDDGTKVVKCIDCGKPVYVSPLNTKTCRCDECQDTYRKNYMRQLMQQKRVSTASSDPTIQN